jgi:hypothetical protein
MDILIEHRFGIFAALKVLSSVQKHPKSKRVERIG